ncbi:hypothetical protein [Carboxylicivirga taeanensis]|uniref:hypothetical protein n=1 Tax=Carboxylicivirga taeanensis TaxID=1416875 RepID=UPI003F6DE761
MKIEQMTVKTNVETEAFFFGHQSVGQDLVDGLEMINGLQKIAGLKDSNQIDSLGFYHDYIGENRDPHSKIDAFKSYLVDNGKPFKYAGFKFCYIDFNESTDVQTVFNSYVEAVREIETKQPHIRIVHFTVPLRQVDTGVKLWAKEFLNRNTQFKANQVREQYNTLLREKYGNARLFDIAYLETVKPSNEETLVRFKGESVRSLNPAYTYDGGHLNETGKRMLAAHFVNFVTTLR